MSEDEHQIGYKVLPRGTPVLTSDGHELGTVSKVMDNVREHIFDGIVVTTKEGKRFVDAPEVETITNLRVTLNIDAAQAADLPGHKGVRGHVENAAKRRANRWRRRFGG